MNATKKISWFVSSLVVIGSSQTFAMPITFEFTGVVESRRTFDAAIGVEEFDSAVVGRSYTAQFSFETDTFLPGLLQQDLDHLELVFETPETALSAWSGSLTIDGSTFDLAIFGHDYVRVGFVDSQGIDWLTGGPSTYPDKFFVGVGSIETDSAGFERQQSLSFVSWDEPGAYVDLEQSFSVERALDFPLRSMTSLSYVSQVLDCSLGWCTQASQEVTTFTVDSVRRSVSVPEPDTFALFAAGLLITVGSRRRVVAPGSRGVQ